MTMSVWSSLLAQQRNEALDDLLSRWHHWQTQQTSTARGHAARSTVVGDYIVSRQHDDANGALYDDEEQVTMRAVQANVDNMAEPYRSAAYVMARSLCLGPSAFTSPRLPKFPAERDRVLAHARQWLILRLVGAGMME
jgi:hypothetical protein